MTDILTYKVIYDTGRRENEKKQRKRDGSESEFADERIRCMSTAFKTKTEGMRGEINTGRTMKSHHAGSSPQPRTGGGVGTTKRTFRSAAGESDASSSSESSNFTSKLKANPREADGWGRRGMSV